MCERCRLSSFLISVSSCTCSSISGEPEASAFTSAADSVTTPVIVANRVETYLNNTMDYASYVDQGHRMDRHFVPGLYVNPESGLLEYDPTAKVGLVVGTMQATTPRGSAISR